MQIDQFDRQWCLSPLNFEIPTLFLDDFGIIGVPKVHYNVFEENPKTDEYDQYAIA